MKEEIKKEQKQKNTPIIQQYQCIVCKAYKLLFLGIAKEGIYLSCDVCGLLLTLPVKKIEFDNTDLIKKPLKSDTKGGSYVG